jgi:hypothetical protein
MTRGWWGWMSYEARRNRHEGDEQPEPDHRDHLDAPSGTQTWICMTPSGAKTCHDTAQQAANRAATTIGAVWYPAIIELEETG